MALFDGPVKGFAERFCRYLDARVEDRFKHQKEATEAKDNWEAMKSAIVGETLAEVSAALKHIVGND